MGLQPISVQDNTFDYTNDLKFQKWLANQYKINNQTVLLATAGTAVSTVSSTTASTFKYDTDTDFKLWLNVYQKGNSMWCADGTCIAPGDIGVKFSKSDATLPSRVYTNKVQGTNNTGLTLQNNLSEISLPASGDINLNTTSGIGNIYARGKIDITSNDLTTNSLSSRIGSFLTLKSGAGLSQIQLQDSNVNINTGITVNGIVSSPVIQAPAGNHLTLKSGSSDIQLQLRAGGLYVTYEDGTEHRVTTYKP